MCAERQSDASASVPLGSVYFEKEVEKPRNAIGVWWEGDTDGGGFQEKSVEEEAEAGGGTTEAWVVLREEKE